MTPLLQNPYAEFLASVEKPARYIGGEHFLIRKEWAPSMTKLALCFPEVYEIGMAHLGFKILYNEVNRYPDLLAERCFAPWMDLEKELRTRQLPLISLESYRPLCDFDLIGFSLQFEMTYTNILNMLDLGRIPLWSHERGEKDPFVLVGGPCATHPEPLAPFVDIVVIGDGEAVLAQLAHFIGKTRREGWSRQEILKAIAPWPGVYIPQFYSTEIDPLTGFEVVTGPTEQGVPPVVKRHIIANLEQYAFPIRSPIPHMTAIFDKFSIELSRGCTEGCRFCQAGIIYRPVRERDPKTAINAVMQGLKENGYQEASLTCLSTADYSAVTPLVLDLLDKMKEEKATLGIASLRAYGLDEKVLDKMAEVKNSSLTFAPEAGSERMRRVINKNISEQDMLSTAEKIFLRGWQKMKLYFMIGLPTETDEDVEAIMEIANKSRLIAHKVHVKSPNITVSVSSFVPKPHTPFQWSPMISYDEIERKQEMLWLLARQYRLNFRKHHSKTSIIEGVLARGDRRLAPVLFEVWKLGARFDGWEDQFDFSLWTKALETHQIAMETYLGEISEEARLPWSHIDIGVEKEFLLREWHKALKERPSPPCGKVAGKLVHFNNLADLQKTHDEEKKKLVCYSCGVTCDLDQMVDERKDFLQKLDATTPSPYQPPAVLQQDPLKLREKRGQNIGFRYRLEFAKIGPLTFISHLDLQKVLSRILKRCDLKLLYSEGYNPRPLVGFGPALPLGMNALSEYVDIRTPDEWSDLPDILSKLQSHSERGLLFLNLEAIPHKTPSLQEMIVAYDYIFPLHQDHLKVEVQGLRDKVEQFFSQEQVLFEVVSHKKKPEVKDLRPYLIEMGFVEHWSEIGEEILSTIHEVTPCIHRQGVKVKVAVNKGQTLRPRDLQEALCNFQIPTHTAIKTKTWFTAH